VAGKDSGERLWPFPMDPDFDTALKSSVADVLQCTVSSEADHILAAVFLKKFVHKDINWVHLDLSPAAKSGAKVSLLTTSSQTYSNDDQGTQDSINALCACACACARALAKQAD
jgi:leucyl aminopeptidase